MATIVAGRSMAGELVGEPGAQLRRLAPACFDQRVYRRAALAPSGEPRGGPVTPTAIARLASIEGM